MNLRPGWVKIIPSQITQRRRSVVEILMLVMSKNLGSTFSIIYKKKPNNFWCAYLLLY